MGKMWLGQFYVKGITARVREEQVDIKPSPLGKVARLAVTDEVFSKPHIERKPQFFNNTSSTANAVPLPQRGRFADVQCTPLQSNPNNERRGDHRSSVETDLSVGEDIILPPFLTNNPSVNRQAVATSLYTREAFTKAGLR